MIERRGEAKQWITDAAERVAIRHAVTPRTVRGWLSTGCVHKDVADHLASLSDYGISSEKINAMVATLQRGEVIGDLEEWT